MELHVGDFQWGILSESFPKQQHFSVDKIESICRCQFEYCKNKNAKIYLIDKVENIVGKGENACYGHFLLFPQYFQKTSS